MVALYRQLPAGKYGPAPEDLGAILPEILGALYACSQDREKCQACGILERCRQFFDKRLCRLPWPGERPTKPQLGLGEVQEEEDVLSISPAPAARRSEKPPVTPCKTGRSHPNYARSPRVVKARERALKALQLRQEGRTYLYIAEEMGYSSAAGACMAVSRILTEQAEEGSPYS